MVAEHRKKHLILVSILKTVYFDLFQRLSLIGLNFLLLMMVFINSAFAVEEFVILLQIVNYLILTVNGEVDSARAAHAE